MFEQNQGVNVIKQSGASYVTAPIIGIVGGDVIWGGLDHGYITVNSGYANQSSNNIVALGFGSKHADIKVTPSHEFDFVTYGRMSVQNASGYMASGALAIKLPELPMSSGFGSVQILSITNVSGGTVGNITVGNSFSANGLSSY